MGNLRIIICERLKFIRDFYNHSASDVWNEWQQLDERNKQGEFPEYEDYESAKDFPLFRGKFSAGAIIHELNSLAEDVLHSKATPAWMERQGKIAKKRVFSPVWEQSIGTTWELVEDYYHICRSDLPGWDAYSKLRDVANAIKHRQGFRRFSETVEKGLFDMDNVQYRVTFESVKDLPDRIEPFLIDVACLRQKKIDANMLA